MMKRIALIFAMLLSFVLAEAQDYIRMKANYVTYRFDNGSGRLGDWSTWRSCNIKIAIDFRNERITIYSSETQVYEIMKYHEGTYQGKIEWSMNCYDKNGGRCLVDTYLPKNEWQSDQSISMYVRYNDAEWGYMLEFY